MTIDRSLHDLIHSRWPVNFATERASGENWCEDSVAPAQRCWGAPFVPGRSSPSPWRRRFNRHPVNRHPVPAGSATRRPFRLRLCLRWAIWPPPWANDMIAAPIGRRRIPTDPFRRPNFLMIRPAGCPRRPRRPCRRRGALRRLRPRPCRSLRPITCRRPIPRRRNRARPSPIPTSRHLLPR
jgi:hypothetical protein